MYLIYGQDSILQSDSETTYRKFVCDLLRQQESRHFFHHTSVERTAEHLIPYHTSCKCSWSVNPNQGK